MNASGGVPGCAMLKRDMYKKYGRWPCHKYYVNYLIMQSNMIMMKHVIINGTVEVAWQYISKCPWKCNNSRYCGYFEEGIWWVYGTGEGCAALERLAMVER